MSPACATNADLARADTTNLCMGATAETALRIWARLRLTRELLLADQAPEATASLRLAITATRDLAGSARATAVTAISGLGRDILRECAA